TPTGITSSTEIIWSCCALRASSYTKEHLMSDAVFDQNLRKYASLLVNVGVNLRAGDLLHLTASLTDDPTIRKLVHYTIEAAYQAGAKYVDVNWNDDEES